MRSPKEVMCYILDKYVVNEKNQKIKSMARIFLLYFVESVG